MQWWSEADRSKKEDDPTRCPASSYLGGERVRPRPRRGLVPASSLPKNANSAGPIRALLIRYEPYL
jgi:hypothetical protein